MALYKEDVKERSRRDYNEKKVCQQYITYYVSVIVDSLLRQKDHFRMTSTRLLTIAFCSTLALVACGPTQVDDGNNQVPPEEPTYPSSLPMGDILLQSPLPGTTVGSPLIVTGSARGTWYFEASFPVRLLDGNGNELAAVPAQADGDWMTENFVPFTAILEFAPPATPNGTLILQKDNPSGLPENDASLEVPVLFQ